MCNESYQELMAFKKAARRDIEHLSSCRMKSTMIFFTDPSSLQPCHKENQMSVTPTSSQRGDPHEQHLFTE